MDDEKVVASVGSVAIKLPEKGETSIPADVMFEGAGMEGKRDSNCLREAESPPIAAPMREVRQSLSVIGKEVGICRFGNSCLSCIIRSKGRECSEK